MMTGEIRANYLDFSSDINTLKEDFKNVQKPINDVVGKFLGTSPIDTTLAQISEFIIRHTHNAHVANNLFSVPATSTMTLKDTIASLTRLGIFNTVVDTFLGRTSASEASLTGPTIAEIKRAIDEQKHTSEMVIKFFEGSSPQDITMTFSNIDKYVRDQVQLGIRALLIPFVFNKEAKRMMMSTEIRAKYSEIYDDLLKLKEDFKKVKISHPDRGVKNIVYTVAHGTMYWVRDSYTELSIKLWGIYLRYTCNQYNVDRWCLQVNMGV